MYVITAPFIVVGLIAKLLNKKFTKEHNEVVVHSNKEPQLYSLIEVVSERIKTDTTGSTFQDDFFSEIFKTAAVAG